MLTFAMRHGVAHTVVAVFIVLLSRECNIFVTGSCVKLLYYPRSLENKVVVLSKPRELVLLCHQAILLLVCFRESFKNVIEHTLQTVANQFRISIYIMSFHELPNQSRFTV